MRVFFSVGEPSGDLHGSNLIRELKARAEVECVGFGGPKMQAAGCELLFDLTTLAVMFFADVLKNIRQFFRQIAAADAYFASHVVDAVVLIDYPGFNWWIARKARRHQIPVFYYGVPQMWAWAPWRVRKLRRLVDHVLCKLPFEVDWFEQRQCRATYVGHPYFDQLQRQTYDQNFVDDLNRGSGPLLTLLPGSRDSEVHRVLPILLKVAAQVKRAVPECRVSVASFNQAQGEFARQQVQQAGQVADVHVDRTPELMKSATVCVACSGSVSLELLHYRKPTIIVYPVKQSAIWLQGLLLRAKYITLVNLIAAEDIRKKTWRPYDPDASHAEQVVMPEYLTSGDPSLPVARRVIAWLEDGASRQANIEQLDQLANQFAKPGATRRAAEYLLAELNVSDTTNRTAIEKPVGARLAGKRKTA